MAGRKQWKFKGKRSGAAFDRDREPVCLWKGEKFLLAEVSTVRKRGLGRRCGQRGRPEGSWAYVVWERAGFVQGQGGSRRVLSTWKLFSEDSVDLRAISEAELTSLCDPVKDFMWHQDHHSAMWCWHPLLHQREVSHRLLSYPALTFAQVVPMQNASTSSLSLSKADHFSHAQLNPLLFKLATIVVQSWVNALFFSAFILQKSTKYSLWF